MKRFVIMLLLLCLVTGCTTDDSFDYDRELKALIAEVNSDKSGFSTDSLEEQLGGYSSSYALLFKSIWKSSTIELESAGSEEVTLKFIYWSYNDVYSKVTTDVSGFVSDVRNLQDLGVSANVINDYVYDYLVKMITNCNKESHSVKCTLTQYTQAPLIFTDNKPLLEDLEVSISKLVYDLEQYALNWEEIHTTTDADSFEYKILEKDRVTVMNYCEGGTITPISIKITEILGDTDAQGKIESLSENNKGLTGVNTVYLEYEITNYSGRDMVFSSRFYDADTKELELYYSDFTFSGVPKQYNVPAGSTVAVKDAIIFNHDFLVWYDETASEIYQLKLK
ncbi:MAG: hypothetical protein NC393_10310 [Clostridium sp.]|nr:hypothetical protein [Clostridium sp.]MCM1207495.1 hypothetical protein [Ruminococcus sp.]